MKGQSEAAVVCCSVAGLKRALTAWRDENPSEAVGFKLVFLVCLSLVIQSRVCMLILRQVVCVASVSSVVTARASLPPMCQKHDAASCVSSLWCLRNPPQNSKQAKDLNNG